MKKVEVNFSGERWGVGRRYTEIWKRNGVG